MGAKTELHETAKALVADNRGILAADESSGTIKKRFDTIDLESTEENRRAYRDMLFTTPGLEESPTRGSSPGSRWTPAPRTWPARPARR